MKQIKLSLFIIFLAGCQEKYELPLKETDLSLLVVEGVLNVQGPTAITLSRSVKVNDQAQFKPVGGAVIRVEGKDNTNIALREAGNGYYEHTQLPLVIGQEYRIRIRLGNKEYLSDYVVAKKSPAIDSVSWKKNADGLKIYVSTHDPSNDSKYYKWEFDETWEINSYYASRLGIVWVDRPPPQKGYYSVVPAASSNYVCWKYDRSKNIYTGSSAQLQSDIISQQPLLQIPNFSEKIGVRYSILVKQQVLAKEAYEFYRLLKANTESIGTIFDPQPMELPGNIKCISNPAEKVIGFLTASSITEKRIFITAREADWRYPQYCAPERVVDNPDSLAQYLPNYLPFDSETGTNGTNYYLLAFNTCVDCTKRGGNLARPSYW